MTWFRVSAVEQAQEARQGLIDHARSLLRQAFNVGCACCETVFWQKRQVCSSRSAYMSSLM